MLNLLPISRVYLATRLLKAGWPFPLPNPSKVSLMALLVLIGFAPAPEAWGQCFSPPANYPVGAAPSSVAVGDVNKDGKLDLVIANAGSGNVSVLLRNGANTGFFTEATLAVGSPRSVAVGDVNGDGQLDLIAANGEGNNVAVLLRNAANTGFETATYLPVGALPVSVAVGDVNGDGQLDIISANGQGNNVSVLVRNAANTGFVAEGTSAVGNIPNSVAVGDVNGDGKLDILTANQISDDVTVLVRNAANTGFVTEGTPAVGDLTVSVAVGDVNGDGKLDIITANASNNNVSVLVRNASNTGFVTEASPAVGRVPYSVAVGDVNGDGKLDIISANYISDNVSVLLRNAANTGFVTATNLPVGDQPYSVAVGDVNGDGQLDIISANGLGNNVTVLVNGIVAIATPPPAGSVVCAGGTVTAQVSVSGTATAYQWYKDGAPLLGNPSATSATLTIPAATTADTGSYSLVVTGICNSVTTTAFSLSVTTPVPITLSNDGPLDCGKTVVTLTALPGGQGTYGFSTGAISQGNNTAMVSQTGVYSVTLTSAGGCTSTAQTTVRAIDTSPTPFVATQSTPDGLVVQVSGGVQYERIKAIDRINGYEIRQTEQNRTGYFVITQPGPYSITVIGNNGCRATVMGMF